VPFEPIDHTADLGLAISGGSLDELFTDAVRGFYDSMIDITAISTGYRRQITVDAEALDLLLLALLDELLFLFDADELLLPHGTVAVTATDTGFTARADLEGELFHRDRHPQRVQIKAVTYHCLEVEQTGEGWRAQVVFDI